MCAMRPELRERLIALLEGLAYPADDMDLCPSCSAWVDEFEHKLNCELMACLQELRTLEPDPALASTDPLKRFYSRSYIRRLLKE